MNSTGDQSGSVMMIKIAVDTVDNAAGLQLAYIEYDFNRNSGQSFENGMEVFRAILLSAICFN